MSFLGQPADWWSCLSFPSRTDAVEGREGEGTDVGAGAIQRLAVIELGYPASADATPPPTKAWEPPVSLFTFSFITRALLNLVNV